jgi:serine/threonine-protein kinase
VIRQVAGAMAVAHVAGILHRDLKPDNIFLSADAEVAGGLRAKVLDFGIAKLASGSGGASGDRLTRPGAFLGTPRYMSPEQLRSAEIDARSDIYSLGLVLYEALTGAAPFDADSLGDFAVAHLTIPPRPPSSVRAAIPDEVDAIVLRCLEKDPVLRFQTMGALADALGEALEGAGTGGDAESRTATARGAKRAEMATMIAGPSSPPPRTGAAGMPPMQPAGPAKRSAGSAMLPPSQGVAPAAAWVGALSNAPAHEWTDALSNGRPRGSWLSRLAMIPLLPIGGVVAVARGLRRVTQNLGLTRPPPAPVPMPVPVIAPPGAVSRSTVGALPRLASRSVPPQELAGVFEAAVPPAFRDLLPYAIEFFRELFRTASRIGDQLIELGAPVIDDLESAPTTCCSSARSSPTRRRRSARSAPSCSAPRSIRSPSSSPSSPSPPARS